MVKKHESYMRWAIALALEGLGRTSPNPMVGALLVKNGKILGEGYHKRAGHPHAEINALLKAGRRAKGADMYVTLEPCAHTGKTPPCTDAIIKAGIKRVIIGTRDPNSLVNGRGIRALKKAGIAVVEKVLEKSARELNEPYNKFIRTGLPFVTAKVALSLDGKIATKYGDSKWITNEECRGYVHRLRSYVDAVIVGAGTAKRDDPKLNVRIKGYVGPEPKAVVVDEKISVPCSSCVFKRKKGETFIATTNQATVSRIKTVERMGHNIILCRKTKEGRVNVRHMLEELATLGFTSVLVEGGGELFAEFYKLGLVDRLVVCISPKIVGGGGKDFLPGVLISKICEAKELKNVQVKTFGDNIVVEGNLNL